MFFDSKANTVLHIRFRESALFHFSQLARTKWLIAECASLCTLGVHRFSFAFFFMVSSLDMSSRRSVPQCPEPQQSALSLRVVARHIALSAVGVSTCTRQRKHLTGTGTGRREATNILTAVAASSAESNRSCPCPAAQCEAQFQHQRGAAGCPCLSELPRVVSGDANI